MYLMISASESPALRSNSLVILPSFMMMRRSLMPMSSGISSEIIKYMI